MQKFNAWLWPDRTIDKRESAQLRSEHNRLVNAYCELVDHHDRLQMKVSHGCTDASCEECDQ